jgi:hypothetical protein
MRAADMLAKGKHVLAVLVGGNLRWPTGGGLAPVRHLAKASQGRYVLLLVTVRRIYVLARMSLDNSCQTIFDNMKGISHSQIE